MTQDIWGSHLYFISYSLLGGLQRSQERRFRGRSSGERAGVVCRGGRVLLV